MRLIAAVDDSRVEEEPAWVDTIMKALFDLHRKVQRLVDLLEADDDEEEEEDDS